MGQPCILPHSPGPSVHVPSAWPGKKESQLEDRRVSE